MSRKVGYTADGVALDLDVGAEHLADERFETAKLDDEQLVLGCRGISLCTGSNISTQLTVHGQVAKSGTCGPLDLGVMAGEEEEDGVEGVAADGADLLFSDLGKGERRATLEVDVVGKGECGQRGEWRPREEVGRGAVCNI